LGARSQRTLPNSKFLSLSNFIPHLRGAFYIFVRVLPVSLSLLLSSPRAEDFAWSFLVCYFEHKSHRVCRGRGGREAKLKNDLSKRKFSIVARTKARGRMLM
jgi:hypothetical protein